MYVNPSTCLLLEQSLRLLCSLVNDTVLVHWMKSFAEYFNLEWEPRALNISGQLLCLEDLAESHLKNSALVYWDSTDTTWRQLTNNSGKFEMVLAETFILIYQSKLTQLSVLGMLTYVCNLCTIFKQYYYTSQNIPSGICKTYKLHLQNITRKMNMRTNWN